MIEPNPDWPEVSLGDACTIVSGATPRSKVAEFWGGDIVWITPTDLGQLNRPEIKGSLRSLTPSGYAECSTTLMQPGAVVMSSRAPIGHLGIAEVPLCTNQGCKSFVPGPDVETRYLYHALRAFMPGIQAMGAGSTFAEVSKAKLSQFEIPLPPLSEQRRIADLLDRQTAYIDTARAALDAQLEAAHALTAAHLRETFESTEAADWTTHRLGDILDRRTEIVHPKNKPTGPATFVGLEHVDKGTGQRLGSLDVRKEDLTGRRAQFYQGDIVYGYLRPYLNKVWIAEFDGLCSVDQYVYTYDPDQVDPGFVSAFMRSPVFLERAPIGDSPGQLPRIRSNEVDIVEIALPPLDHQRRIAAYLRDQHAATHTLIADLTAQRDAVQALPAAHLREAFAGRV